MVAPLSGAVFFAAIFVATATVAFWWIDSGEFANGFTYGGRDFTSYPMTVYSGCSGRSSRTGSASPSSATTRRWRCSAAPDPLGLPGWVGLGVAAGGADRRRGSPRPGLAVGYPTLPEYGVMT